MKKLNRFKPLLIVGATFVIIVIVLLIFKFNHNESLDSNEDNISYDISEELEEEEISEPVITWANIGTYSSMEDLRTMYSIESDTYVTEDDLDVNRLTSANMKVNLDTDEPKILVFHTHSQEYFSDSEMIREDSIVGVGDELCRLLEENYNVKSIHDYGQYDVVNGEVNVNGAYERMEPNIQKILDENPSIEVCIDLHRDITPNNDRFIWDYKNEPTAKVMFFNGMCRTFKDGEIRNLDYLPNPYLEKNLAFSMQMKLYSNEKYPEFTRKNYIRAYRYSLHMREKSLLIELGSDQNTVQEAYNTVEPLAEILMDCIG